MSDDANEMHDVKYPEKEGIGVCCLEILALVSCSWIRYRYCKRHRE